MTNPSNRVRRNGVLALSPLLIMVLLFIGLSVVFGGFHKVPLILVFLFTCVYAFFILRGLSIDSRLTEFSRGAGEPNLLLMVWIYMLAGAFASIAKAMGAVEASVNLTLSLTPPSMLLGGLFLAACLISLSIGTSVGTVVALVPIASGLSAKMGMEMPLMVAAVVGGAFFGDNLSFISDTTVAATRTQGCRMSDKFRVNFLIALPAAVVTFVIYLVMGQGNVAEVEIGAINFWKVLPYLVVLVTAVLGMNVLLVLCMGIVLAGMVGLSLGDFTLAGFLSSLCEGVLGMGELILVSMLAGGLFSLIRRGGGITWLIRMLTRRVRTSRGGELSIAVLVSLVNLCTANNTVAIISVGSLAHDISRRFGIDPRKSASLLDTFSCSVQGLIPYGPQLLLAGGLAVITPTSVLPYLFYPVLLAVSALIAIFIGYPQFKKTEVKADLQG